MTLEICAALLIMLGAVGILLVPLLFGSKIGFLRDDINELVRGRAEVTQQLQLAVGQHDKAMYSNHHKEILRAQNATDAARRRQEESLNSLKKATQFMVTIARYCDKISITEEEQKRERVARAKAYEEIWPIYESHSKLVLQSLNDWFQQLRVRQEHLAKLEKRKSWFYGVCVVLQALGMTLGILALGSKYNLVNN